MQDKIQTNETPSQQNVISNQTVQPATASNTKQSGDVRWNIELKQDDKDYIIIFSHSSFPSLQDYSKLNLANKKIQHLIISEMNFQFLDREIKVSFSRRSLKDINPYKVLYNLYDKMVNHYQQQLQSRVDFAKNLEIYPQVIHYLATPISYEIFFRFNSYKYQTDDRFKEEWLRISNILSYNIYEEVKNDYESSSVGYDIQQTFPPEGQVDRYVQFQHTFKRNIFYGLTTHMKLDQIYFALETQYVPYFVIQKIFLQLDDFYRPTYNLTLQELQPLQKIVNDISMYPSISCILFLPHNTIRKQRLTIDKLSAEKFESRSFMQIRFDQCLHCNKFIQETSKKCLEYRKKFTEAIASEQRQNTMTEQKYRSIEESYFDMLNKLKSQCKNSTLKHEYYLKISFSDLFYYMHSQKNADSSNAGGVDKKGQYQECQLRTFDIFEKVLKKFRLSEEQMRFNHEKQQITFNYQNQSDLEVSIMTFLSLVYQLHFIYQYYYFFSQKLVNQQPVEIKYSETLLKKNNIVMRMSLQNIPYELQLYVEYEKQGLIVFNTHVRLVEKPSAIQRNIVNEVSKTFIQLQGWLLKTLMMNSYMKQDVSYTYLQRGNKLIQWLQRDENKSLKVINLFYELMQLNLPIFNFDLITFEDEDLIMKETLRVHYSQQNMTNNPITIGEDKYKKLFEINFDIDKKNQLIIFIDGSYAFFSFYIDSSNRRLPTNKRYDPKLNIFSDNPHSIIQFLQQVV